MKKNLKEILLKNIIINPINNCWEWQGDSWPSGYGRMSFWDKENKKSISKRTHRISYELFKNESVVDKFVLHKCDNPCCINPDHLFLGTLKDNTQDMIKKGRNKGGLVKKTHCKNGHPFSGYNLLLEGKRKKRICRACKIAANKKRYLK